MLEQFFFNFLLSYSLCIVFYKYKLNNWINQYSNRIKNENIARFVYSLSQCEFCMDFYISIPMTVLLSVFYPFKWILVFFPLMITSLIQIIKK